MMKRTLELIMALVLLVSVFILSREGAALVEVISGTVKQEKHTVVIDPGHGGFDPGKVSVTGALEKDINLKIAFMLKEFLEAEDVTVFLTRDSDAGLYSESSSNKKLQDIKARCSIIEKEKPDLAVSIHQNSYHEEYVNGAQVFYSSGSEKGKRAAAAIQEELIRVLDKENTREIKSNTDYYLLKRTTVPTIIVESGFLSNWKEAALLEDAYYQEKVAWAIHLGVLKYLSEN